MTDDSLVETTQDAPPLPQLIYFADTMCSWCYGFAPQMNRVMLELGDKVTLMVQAGGLRPFSTEVLTDELKPRFRGYREQVQAASGQAFDWSFFERDGFIMDTEPASRAVVTMRNLHLEAAYAYMHAIQRGFFAQNQDIRDMDVLANHAANFDVDPDEFALAFQSDEMRAVTKQDFALAQRFNVTGFPTLFLIKGGAAYQVAVGYAKSDVVVAQIERALAHEAPTPPPAPSHQT